MSSIADRWLLIAVLPLWPLAAAEWVVPERQSSVVFSFPAVVDVDRSATILLLPTADDAIATWVVPHGSAVRRGDPIIIFDAEVHRNRAAEHRYDLQAAEISAHLGELRLQAERKTLEDEREQLRADLRVAQAALKRAQRVDAPLIAGLQAEADRARDELANSRRLLALAQRAFDAGEIIGDALANAQLAVAEAESAAMLAAASLEREQNADQSLELQRLAARVEDVRLRLGIDASGQPVSGAGLTGSFEALEARQRRDRRRLGEERDKAERELHESLRDSADHTPVRSIRIGDRRFHFTKTAPDGAIACATEVFAEERGWGFVAAPAAADLVTRKGRKGELSCLVIAGQARWSVRLPAGTHALHIELGDDREWDGAVVGVEDADGVRCLLAQRRVDPAGAVVEADVRVGDAPLVISFGDGYGKALRASSDGIALPREDIAPGWTPGWMQEPAAFLAGPGSLRLRAVVHQDQARLLRSGEIQGEELADRLAVDQVAWRSADGRSGTAPVANVVRMAVPLGLRSDAQTDGPLDRLGNEVFFTLGDNADPKRLRIGTGVMIDVAVQVPEACTAVPAHLIGRSGERCYVQVAGSDPESCHAVRVDGHYIIAKPLAAHTRLVEVDMDAADSQEQRFPGEIVAGKTHPVVSVTASGRIAEQIPDGSRVEAGQIVVSLYSPWVEDRREENARRRSSAQAAYEEAADSRRVAADRAAVEHRGRMVAEEIARVDAALAAKNDPLEVISAEAAMSQALAVDALATAILERARAAGDVRQLEEAERRAAQAELDRRRAELALAAAHRRSDFLVIAEAEAIWNDRQVDLAGRELDRLQARVQDRAAALSAELQLASAMQGSWWEQAFNRGKDLRAPTSGRLFYRKGWDDRIKAEATFQRDFWVWRGMTVADVLDTSDLAFEADLPEGRVQRLNVGDTVTVLLTRFDQRRIEARIERIGRAVLPAVDDDPLGVERHLGLRRVVRVRCGFTVPVDLRDRLVPGDKADLEFP